MERSVLIPAFIGHPDVETLFRRAGLEVEYALSESERAHGRWAFERSGSRVAAMTEAISAHLPTATVLCAAGVTGHLAVTREMIQSADRLEAIYIGAAGFDRIDVQAATERGIAVFNAPGGNAVGVAEHALGLMLSLTRRIDALARFSRRNRKWAREFAMTSCPPMTLLQGKTLGLVGYGFIGRHVADRARLGFGMQVVGFDPFFDPLEASRQGVELLDLDDVLRRADILSLHLPLNDATKGLIGTREFGLMKSGSYLINTARGGIVDTAALMEALESGPIVGAGLDCVDPEPLPDGHPLFEAENVVLTPHIGGGAPEDIARSDLVAARLVIDYLAGRGARHAVNPDALRRRADRAAQPDQTR